MSTTPKQQYRTVIREITWDIPSRTTPGRTHQIKADGFDGELRCSCPARSACWAIKAVARGDGGRPRIRVSCLPLVKRVRTSDEGQRAATMLDV